MSHWRRQVRITREGWSFLSILAFIILGSILRQINLLMLLSGLMIAPFFFNWRLAMKMVQDIKLDRQLPLWAYARQPFVVQWTVTNEREHVPSWDLKLSERVAAVDAAASEGERAEMIVPQVDAGGATTTSYRCILSRRGLYRFDAVELSSAFPVGLVRARLRGSKRQDLVVAPQLGELTEPWHRLVRSSSVGLRSLSRRRGLADDEFHALRPWRSGDSRRSIHWRSSAKRGDLLVKQFDQRTDRDFGVVLDLWNDGSVSQDSLERCISFFATVVASLDQDVKGHVVIAVVAQPCLRRLERMGQPVLEQVLQHLATVQPRDDRQILDELAELGPSISRDTSLIVLSTRRRPEAGGDSIDRSAMAGVAKWIDVTTPEGGANFRLPEDPLQPDELFTADAPQRKPIEI